ncbi:MAG: hypothetical protein QOD35_427, partial [Nocardioidaceae bacterium]|nr:hypothetical protein [Nocardioidaceae bacterium]
MVTASLDDDGMLVWFSNRDRDRTAAAFARSFLRGCNGTGTGADHLATSTVRKSCLCGVKT